MALELRRLVHGDLRGMFDGPTTPGSGPLRPAGHPRPLGAVHLDRARRADGLRHGMAAGGAGPHGVGPAREGRSSWWWTRPGPSCPISAWPDGSSRRGSCRRAFGVSNVAVLHRVSDLHSVGASDSEQVALAQGLLADSETRVVYAQSPGELARGLGPVVAVVDREPSSCPNCGEGSPCGRWARARSWSSTG